MVVRAVSVTVNIYIILTGHYIGLYYPHRSIYICFLTGQYVFFLTVKIDFLLRVSNVVPVSRGPLLLESNGYQTDILVVGFHVKKVKKRH
jgi:hypothetical protein